MLESLFDSREIHQNYTSHVSDYDHLDQSIGTQCSTFDSEQTPT